MAQETHKFESRYIDNLIGPYPEARDVYIARSPIHHTDKLNCAMVLFQGDEDKVIIIIRYYFSNFSNVLSNAMINLV